MVDLTSNFENVFCNGRSTIVQLIDSKNWDTKKLRQNIFWDKEPRTTNGERKQISRNLYSSTDSIYWKIFWGLVTCLYIYIHVAYIRSCSTRRGLKINEISIKGRVDNRIFKQCLFISNPFISLEECNTSSSLNLFQTFSDWPNETRIELRRQQINIITSCAWFIAAMLTVKTYTYKTIVIITGTTLLITSIFRMICLFSYIF